MRKTLLHRLFGFGRVPKAMKPILEREGIVLLDEGIGGSITFRNFRALGKRYGYRKNWFTGSLVVTGQRFAGSRSEDPSSTSRSKVRTWTNSTARWRKSTSTQCFVSPSIRQIFTKIGPVRSSADSEHRRPDSFWSGYREETRV